MSNKLARKVWFYYSLNLLAWKDKADIIAVSKKTIMTLLFRHLQYNFTHTHQLEEKIKLICDKRDKMLMNYCITHFAVTTKIFRIALSQLLTQHSRLKYKSIGTKLILITTQKISPSLKNNKDMYESQKFNLKNLEN